LTIPEGTKQVHFIGIGGYGMSALAQILLKKGYRVSGSDIRASALTASLVEAGARVLIGHRRENIGSADLAIYSTAIAGDNPELKEVNRRGITLWHRSELLASLLNNSYGIAIAGAHGKTTTTAMVALLLETAGSDPTAIVGGVVPAFGSNARFGAGPHLVAEADESDSSFTRYYPKIALVTGIESDHLEHYENDYNRLKQAYKEFLSHLSPEKGLAVICADDSNLVQLCLDLSCRKIYYSIKQTGNLSDPVNKTPDYYAASIQLRADSSTFAFGHRGKILLPEVTLGVPGKHNVSNAVGALALASALNLDLKRAAPALAHFSGAGRRFEQIGVVKGIQVIDDYAHHPTEIRATLETARHTGRRVLCLFQPHRYSRTANLFNDFARAFDDADRVYLHEIYAADEDPLPGVSGKALAAAISKESGKPVFFNPVISVLEEQVISDAQPGDLIITMGAGDITYSAPRILILLDRK